MASIKTIKCLKTIIRIKNVFKIYIIIIFFIKDMLYKNAHDRTILIILHVIIFLKIGCANFAASPLTSRKVVVIMRWSYYYFFSFKLIRWFFQIHTDFFNYFFYVFEVFCSKFWKMNETLRIWDIYFFNNIAYHTWEFYGWLNHGYSLDFSKTVFSKT